MKAPVTYRIVGADGKEYGPVSLKEIQSWAKQGRINGSSLVERSDQGVWSTAASYQEIGVVDCIAAPGEIKMDAAESDEIEKKVRYGGGWFYWIAALSLINSICVLSGADFGFVLGLSLTQLIDYAVREFAPKDIGFIAKCIAFAFDLAAAGLFVTFGIYARRKQSWAFVAGLVIYGFDTIFTVLGMMWLGIALHGWAIYGLVVGLKAASRWRALTREVEGNQASARAAQSEPLREAA